LDQGVGIGVPGSTRSLHLSLSPSIWAVTFGSQGSTSSCDGS
jgi:hypothetical protein